MHLVGEFSPRLPQLLEVGIILGWALFGLTQQIGIQAVRMLDRLIPAFKQCCGGGRIG